MKRCAMAICVLVALSACSAWAGPVLSVAADGTLMRDGKPYCGVGINFFGAFYDAVRPDGKPTYKEDFPLLAERGVPFIRFAATPFWPAHYKLYRDDRAEYFRRFDDLVKTAEDCGLGLVPSLFWNPSSVSDLVGEPRSAWGDPASRTRAFMRTYTTEVISRYRNSKAIWMWEFGNEFSLHPDLPNAAEHRPGVNVKLGTPAERTAADDLTGAQFVSAMTRFAALAHKLDPTRPLSSGNAVPRPYAWHNWREHSWTFDSTDQYAEMLSRDNPDPIDTLSIHIYPSKKNEYFGVGADKFEVIRESMRVARNLNKALFIGEFGANEKQWGDQSREQIEKLFDLIVEQRVPLSAFWVWRLDWQEPTFSVTGENKRSYILDLIRDANRRLNATGAALPKGD